jgi:hypothetical protein
LQFELATDRNGRVLENPASPNGILLFKQISALCVTYVDHVAQPRAIPEDQLYPLKYKGVAAFYNIFQSVPGRAPLPARGPTGRRAHLVPTLAKY